MVPMANSFMKWSILKMPGFVGLYILALCFCFSFLLKGKKNWKPLSISFLTYTRTICQDNLAHKSLANSKNCVRLQAAAQKMHSFISFFYHNVCFHFPLKGLQLLIFIFILYDLIYMFKCNWNCSLSYLVLSGSVWSGKRRLPKDGPPTSFAKRMTPSWQECAMCILSKHQHQFNWKIEAQFLITFNPGLSTLRLFSALQLLD